eukprot:CAMPEP_0194027352 /NCGR_PEP_ID=MMETSP0009_2-20130614/1514_1 /TAXON_ID=210454 /ORGANISM="Grammatophora oceanica, Strain CCMP 410" /LENGTH=266 /DNA_ID=CAMNT_0038666393 /DNA_START=22 /DNA_END=822 /DNA_ORIENTATION=+
MRLTVVLSSSTAMATTIGLLSLSSSRRVAAAFSSQRSFAARRSLSSSSKYDDVVSAIREPISSLFFSSTKTTTSELEEEVDPGVVEGTDLRVLKYPHPSLRAENTLVTEEELKDGSIAQIAKEMFLVMYAANGVGLAAPQVGINKRLMIFNEHGDKTKWLDEMVLVNPKIVKKGGGTDVETEGCLSFPGMNGPVQRNKWIQVEALNKRGKKIKKKFFDWEARIFQHEYDHLDGTVYIDHLAEEARAEVQPRLDELIEEYDGEDGAV